jgi:hypothetical protein
MDRCDLCGVPMGESATGYCSERCLCWDFFGVPALKRQDFLEEMRANQRRREPTGRRPRTYEGLFTQEEERVLSDAIAHLKMYRSDG